MSRSKSRRTKRSNRRLPNFTDTTPRYGTLFEYLGIRPTAQLEEQAVESYKKKWDKWQRKVPYEPVPTKTSPSYGRIRPKNIKKRGFAPVTMTAPSAPVIKNKICVDRSTRKEIIHALGHSGKGGQKSPVWKKSSKVRC